MCFLNRAKVISFNKDLFKRETSYLSNLFLKNGYPNWFFDGSIKKNLMMKINQIHKHQKQIFFAQLKPLIMAYYLTNLIIVSFVL